MSLRHTADKRSEKPLIQSKKAERAREEYSLNQSRRICVSCKVTPIGGSRKSYCYDCSAKQVQSTYKTGFRSVMRGLGIDQNTTSFTEKQITDIIKVLKGSKA